MATKKARKRPPTKKAVKKGKRVRPKPLDTRVPDRATDADGKVLNEDPAVLIDYFDTFDIPRNEYAFLSNFHVVSGGVKAWLPVYWSDYLEEMWAPTTEHLFQAAKARTSGETQRVLHAAGPGASKQAGRSLTLAPDWEDRKYEVMRLCLEAKFAFGTGLGWNLVATGTAYLVEGTYWGDRCWGVDLNRPGRPGANLLGTMLMAQRARLQYLAGDEDPF